ncbi:PEP/pyruvate-binding domain-containing protein [uncultured Desulfobacter sp.]|uniref:PEP/pyruvate-binding domain-containing protein n=1 Tax=uncultured Desulfobacter sp. TaxID=240139 RepID=UPI002AAAD85E|nr:PEP/pyruvate-binding domain-containing protein [uncultured Desulfobacter sp.]
MWFKSIQDGDACRPLFAMDPEQTARYNHFRALLDHNRVAINLMTDLEQTYYDNRPFTAQMVEHKCTGLLSEVQAMVQSLSGLSSRPYERLSAVLQSLLRYFRDELRPPLRAATDALTLPVSRIESAHDRAVGAKAANLARARRELNLPVPNGFAITTSAYRLFLRETGLSEKIDDAMAQLTADDPASIESAGREIRSLILGTPLPGIIRTAIEKDAAELAGDASAGFRLAVRSSAIGEDGEISFAGQYTSVLDVPIEDLTKAYTQVVASKYSTPALSYRLHHGVDDGETPMAVLVLEMIRPRLSGVLYTADPVGEDRDTIRISAVHGLGDTLVGGKASPQRIYRISKSGFKILEMAGDVPSPGANASETTFLRDLWRYAKLLEDCFQRPMDIEWAVYGDHRVYILQARPLLVSEQTTEPEIEPAVDYPGHPVLINGGKCAAGGVVSGRVLVVKNTEADNPIPRLEPDTILVARAASTSITPWMGKVKGIITDVGGTASHLASVAREFGVPALFGTQSATETLTDGQEITLWASRARVYDGVVEELTQAMRPVKRPIFASSLHLRLQRMLDRITPLNLTGPDSPQFTQEECRTVHDIIRYCHDMSVREMFRFGKSAGHPRGALRLRATLPLQLYALDLGNGLRWGLTTCDDINVHDVTSAPFRALWRGISHPGVNWTSSIAMNPHNLMSLMAGEAGYALVSADYMNLSLRFNSHFATVDTLCGTDPEYNYINLQFSGGAGGYFGRSLRIQYMAAVLSRLGFETSVNGDLIEAGLSRLEQASMEEALDQLGRLLGTSRLLDMTMNSPEQAVSLTESFFQGKYDVLGKEHEGAPKDFYLITGNWKESNSEMEPGGVLQDGSHFASWITTGVSQAMTRLLGKRYREMMDNIGAYHYFPLAIAKDSTMTGGTVTVKVKPLSGTIDQAGGLAFAIRDFGNYFVFRVNTLEGNAVLFEFKNGKRVERANIDTPVAGNVWYRLGVTIRGRCIQAFLDDGLMVEYEPDRGLEGHVGLWTKADSVTLFKELTIKRSTS